MRRGLVGLAVAVGTGCVLLPQAGATEESARGNVGPQAEFKVKASKGYVLRGSGLSGYYTLTARKGRKGIALGQGADLTVTKKEIKAKYPDFGKVDLTFNPSGPKETAPLPGGCSGEPGQIRKGRWVGKIRFRTEVTKVRTEGAKGHVVLTPGDVDCPIPPGEGLRGVRDAPYGSDTFDAFDPHDGPPTFAARRNFELGSMQMTHFTSVVGAEDDYDRVNRRRGLIEIQLTPPAPFSGTGNYLDQSWSGDLEVRVLTDTIPLINDFAPQPYGVVR